MSEMQRCYERFFFRKELNFNVYLNYVPHRVRLIKTSKRIKPQISALERSSYKLYRVQGHHTDTTRSHTDKVIQGHHPKTLTNKQGHHTVGQVAYHSISLGETNTLILTGRPADFLHFLLLLL